MKLPRVMITAPKSGSGKTILTCGLLRLMKDRGTDIRSYKCGPDYIDPMFHRSVIDVPGGNLDTFFCGDDELISILTEAGCEAAVIEGVMGIYDGITGASGKGSCYDVSRATDTPVILMVDVKGMGMTMLSVIRGILADDRFCRIKGIVLNRISPHYYSEIAPFVREMLGRVTEERHDRVELLGGIPNSPDIRLESRHLGLVMPEEIADLREQVAEAAKLIADNLDVEMLLNIMDMAGELPDKAAAPIHDAGGDAGRLTLAVARDEAFCFYYEENLRLLESRGIAIKEFSPLHDSSLPADADGMLLGGGYPELHAEVLSANAGMLDSIKEAIASGMPSLAECGGFMALMDELEDKDGRAFPMAGVIRGKSYHTGKLIRFGYITVSGKSNESPGGGSCSDAAGMSSLLDGLSVKGHEFHYSDSTDNGNDAVAVKPGNVKARDCIHAGPDHIWGYPHLYYPSCPELADRFKAQMELYHLKKAGSDIYSGAWQGDADKEAL